jgi:electron transport complex protein RnfE
MNILIAENISNEVLNGFVTGSVSVQSITLFAIIIGAIFGYTFADGVMPLLFILAPGGFLVLGYLMVLFNKVAKR